MMMVCSFSWAAWEITSYAQDHYFYHDKSTIRRNGVIAKMWIMMENLEMQKSASGSYYKSASQLFAYNCREETLTLIAHAMYSGSMGTGSVVSTATLKESEWDWRPVFPGSIREADWKIACGKR